MHTKRASQLIGTLVVIGAAACGKNNAADGGLARDLAAAKSSASDLELAPHAGASQVVVSAIEGGPQAAPAKSVHAPVAKPAARSAPPRVETRSVAPAPRPAVIATSSAPTPRTTSERAPDPAPLPPASGQSAKGERQNGTYSTEADIFRRMPWIRP